ncbi:amidohydrolase family protein [Mycobacterium kansasii]|uniref:Amidohydrolase family protein n=1 Tax=Mycobacterium kansasii TaxID=1768 RepID=A0A1V3XJ51_MYCKA|nr:amidohydrolase family protein [Mycobacterium kansasii]
MTVEQAIRAQTLDAAWQLFADDVIGSLEVGKYADMVVLSQDPRTVAPEEIADLEVRATFLAGRQVYGPTLR